MTQNGFRSKLRMYTASPNMSTENASSKRWIYVSLLLLIVVASGFSASYFQLRFQYSDLKRRYDDIQPQLSAVQSEIEGLRSLLTSLQTSLQANGSTSLTPEEIYNLTKPSIVLITAKRSTAWFGVTKVQGSGFVYDKTGHIITNNHVVEGSVEIQVTFPHGTIVKAEIVGTDPYSDLAVIKVNVTPDKLWPLRLGNSSNLVVGETVLAMGNPFGLSGSMTKGIISQLGRSLETTGGYLIVDVIQIDAAINPGNSGGPLLNMMGEVVGVNTAIATTTGTFSGVGFAISSNLVSRVIPALIKNGSYKHPWMGVQGVDVTPEIAEAMGLSESRGFLVISVTKGSPADQAGVRGGDRTAIIDGQKIAIGGDIIIGVDDVDVRKIEDILIYLERNKNVGDTINLKIIRDKQTIQLNLTLGARPTISSGTIKITP